MLVTFSRFPILFSDVQPVNVFLLIAISFPSPSTFFSFSQFRNAPNAIRVTFGNAPMFSSSLHPENASEPIRVTLSKLPTVFRDLQETVVLVPLSSSVTVSSANA